MTRIRTIFFSLLFLLALPSACRFSPERPKSPPLPASPAPATPPPSAVTMPTRPLAGFASPAFDIAGLPPVIFPPLGAASSDCLQGPEPDASAPSARLFEWSDPFALENRLLCIYGFPSSGDAWRFSIELTGPSGNVYSESFTLEGDRLVGDLTGPRSYVPSLYDGVDYIGVPLFFGDPLAEGQWVVSARELDGSLVLEETALLVEGVYGAFILAAPPGNPFDVFPLEEASAGQTAHIYLVGGEPHSEYVIALYSIDPAAAAGFGLQPGEPAPMEILAISTLVPRFATVLTSGVAGNLETAFYIDASIPAGQYFLVVSPGLRGSLELSLIPMLVWHD